MSWRFLPFSFVLCIIQTILIWALLHLVTDAFEGLGGLLLVFVLITILKSEVEE